MSCELNDKYNIIRKEGKHINQLSCGLNKGCQQTHFTKISLRFLQTSNSATIGE